MSTKFSYLPSPYGAAGTFGLVSSLGRLNRFAGQTMNVLTFRRKALASRRLIGFSAIP